MRLLWKRNESSFSPHIAVVGLGSFLVGAYWTAQLASAALRNPILWVLVAIPSVVGVVGVTALVREYQLWKRR